MAFEHSNLLSGRPQSVRPLSFKIFAPVLASQMIGVQSCDAETNMSTDVLRPAQSTAPM